MSPVDILPSEDNSVLLQNATLPQPIINSSVPIQQFQNNSMLQSKLTLVDLFYKNSTFVLVFFSAQNQVILKLRFVLI